MSLIRYEPYSLLDRLHREFFGPSLWGRYISPELEVDNPVFEASTWLPAVDVKEEQDRYVLHADLPGVEAKDIDVTVENGVLTLKGKREHEKTEERNGYKHVERMQGTFQRRFSLPESVEADKVEAKSRDGVLEVVVPKHAKIQPRRITVKG
jgi:HSP20 family protein